MIAFLVLFVFVFLLNPKLKADLYSDLISAKRYALKFEIKKSREITRSIRKKIINECWEKEKIKAYAQTLFIDGISLWMEGKFKEARNNFINSINLFPDLLKEIEKDQEIPDKIKDFIKSEIEPLPFFPVNIVSEPEGQDIIINAEKSCKTPCRETLRYGLNIICINRKRCTEKFIFSSQTIAVKGGKKSFFSNPILIGVVGGIAVGAVITTIIIIEKQTSGIKIVISE